MKISANLSQRLLTGFILVNCLLAATLMGGMPFTILFGALALLSLREFLILWDKAIYKPQKTFTYCMALLSVLLAGLLLQTKSSTAVVFSGISPAFLSPFIVGLVLILLFPFVCLAELYRKMPTPFINIALSCFALCYTVMPFLCLMALGFVMTDYCFEIPLGFLLLLWSQDSFAYVWGSLLGKTPLFARHSPKKTLEGFLGGAFSCLIVAFGLAYLFPDVHFLHWIVMSLLISVFSTGGDLAESMLKRSMSIKDSGKSLPGHGGFLDRFDGLLIAAPVVYFFFLAVKMCSPIAL